MSDNKDMQKIIELLEHLVDQGTTLTQLLFLSAIKDLKVEMSGDEKVTTSTSVLH